MCIHKNQQSVGILPHLNRTVSRIRGLHNLKGQSHERGVVSRVTSVGIASSKSLEVLIALGSLKWVSGGFFRISKQSFRSNTNTLLLCFATDYCYDNKTEPF